MRFPNKLFGKNRLKTNIYCIFKHSIVCSALKCQSFSQEILVEERIPTGSHEENNALLDLLGPVLPPCGSGGGSRTCLAWRCCQYKKVAVVKTSI